MPRRRFRLAEMMAAANDQSITSRGADPSGEDRGDSTVTVDALDVLAIAEIKLGKSEDAVLTLERSMEQFPGELNTFILLARTKLDLHDKKGAEEALEKACEQLPKAAAAHRILGQFYFAENRLSEAEKLNCDRPCNSIRSPRRRWSLWPGSNWRKATGRKPRKPTEIARAAGLSVRLWPFLVSQWQSTGCGFASSKERSE